MPIEQPADGDTSWGNEVRAAIAAVNTLEGVTAANLPETIRDTIGSTVVGTGLVTVTPNDALDTVTVATSATANSTDAQLRDRATHTGTQLSTTISDLTEAIQDIVAAFIVAGTNVSATYSDAAGTLTLAASGGTGGTGGGLDAEAVRDTIGAALLGSGLISVAVNDTADTITISTTATANSTDAVLLNRANHTGTQVAATISDLSEAVDDRVATLLTAGANVSLTYNDTDNTLTIAASGGAGGGLDVEGVQDTIASTVVGSGLITATYNDTVGTHTISTSLAPTFTGTVTAPRFITPAQTITYAATITPNAAAGSLFRCTATGNLTLNDPTGGVDGQAVTVEILASGGDRTLNFAGGGASVVVPSGLWWSGTLRLNGSTWLLDDDLGSGGSSGGGSTSLPFLVGATSLVDGTNRTAALQALFDSVPSTGARVVLPAGWIRTLSTVQITQDNTVVQGAGLSVRDGSSQGGVGTRIGPQPGDTFTGTDILLVQRTANDRPVHGVVLQDFGVEGSNVAGTVGIHFRSNRSRIDRVSVIQCASHGIRLHGYTSPAWDLYDSTIQGLISDCGGTALWFDDGATDMHVLPGTVLFDCNKGIHFTGGGSAQVTGVHTYDNAINNIHFDGAGSRTKISNCKIEGAGQHGILIDSTTAGYSDIQITGCNLANNGDSANNTYDQIHTVGPSGNGITRLNVGHCSFTNKGGNLNLPRYGININSTALQTATIVGNSFGPASHWGTGPLRDAGSGSSVRQIRHNGGYITEASGTATVASGATTTTVTHGISVTPTAAHVNVTPTNNLGNATKFWVSTVGATTFVINVNSDPGATTATFAWKVEVA